MTGAPLRNEIFRCSNADHIRLASSKPELRRDIDVLKHCLLHGHSIFAGHSGYKDAGVPSSGSTQMVFCQSSGSSDKAKTIRRTAASWLRSFAQTRAQFSLTPKDDYAVLGALSHSLTLYGLLEGLHVGACVDVLTGLSPKRQAHTLHDANSAVLYATPSQLRLLLEGANLLQTTLPQLRLIFSGGGKLDADCRAGLQRLCPNARILEFYGASETSLITMSDDDTPDGSVGRAYAGVEIDIRQANGSLSLGPGEVGDIWIKSPYLFDGYEVGSSDDTVWLDDFVTVGEMGYLDDKGFLFLKGRKSRMVTIADQNVFLEDIEEVLQADPSVRLCAVLAQPDRQRGHVLVAIIELNDPTVDPSNLVSTLKASCRKAFGPLATPKAIHCIETMPMLPAGKPDLVRLKQWLGETIRGQAQ